MDFPEADFERVKLSDAATTAEVALPQKKKNRSLRMLNYGC